MSITIDLLTEILTQARVSSRAVAQLSTKAKNSVLLAVADALESEAEFLIAENSKDVTAATQSGLDHTR